MAVTNTGTQIITWKYSTPLTSETLNYALGGFSNEGLFERPTVSLGGITAQGSSSVTISNVSLLITPTDYITVDGVKPVTRVVTRTAFTLTITRETVAIGFTYSYKKNSVTQAQWFGEFQPLTLSDIKNDFKGIIILTVQNNSGNVYSVTSNGADLSDALLIREGYNPNKWVSLISPRRITDFNDGYNKLELRSHNDEYVGYFNGHLGFMKINKPKFDMTDTHGVFDKKYNLLKLSDDKSEIVIANSSDNIDFMEDGEKIHTDGEILCLLIGNDPDIGSTENSNKLSNTVTIKPVENEHVSIYYEDETLYIR